MALPTYRSPPLVEVVLGVTFKPASPITSAHLGAFWASVRDRFPVTQEHAPIDARIERFGTSAVPSIQVEFGTSPGSRLWLINEEDSELIQIQHNMFLRNWRRYPDPEIPYPGFAEQLFPNFMCDFELFEQSMEGLGCGVLVPEQIEVTYVNLIEDQNPSGPNLGNVFRFWNSDSGLGSVLEMVNVSTTRVMENDSSEPIGRLHVDLKRGLSGPSPAVQLSLTARGFSDPIDEFVELGHEAIVSTFDEMITEQMRDLWGKVR